MQNFKRFFLCVPVLALACALLAPAHGALVNCLTFDDTDGTNILKASVGPDAFVRAFRAEDVEGLGETGIGPVTNEAALAGLPAGSGAIAIPKGPYILVPHGVGTGAYHPHTMFFRFYMPTVAGAIKRAFYKTDEANTADGSFFYKDKDGTRKFGGSTWNSYSTSTYPRDEWHELTLCYNGSKKTAYYDGVAVEGLVDQTAHSVENLADKPYVLLGADEDGEDDLIYFDEFRIWDTVVPDWDFPAATFECYSSVSFRTAGETNIFGFGSASTLTFKHATFALRADYDSDGMATTNELGSFAAGESVQLVAPPEGGRAEIICVRTDPAPEIRTFAVSGAGYDSVSFDVDVPFLGLGATAATIAIDISHDAEFAESATLFSTNVTDAWAATGFEVSCLPTNVQRFVRVRADNGVAVATNGPVSFETLPAFDSFDIGYWFRDGGLAVPVSVSSLRVPAFDAALYLDGGNDPAATAHVAETSETELFAADVATITDVRVVVSSGCFSQERTLTAVPATFPTTGATVTDLGDAEVFVWSATGAVGTITIPAGGAKFDMLLVGGGGAGGLVRGGGGGGGGVVYTQILALAEGTYTIQVGAGGEPQSSTVTGTQDNNGQVYVQGRTPATADGGASTISNATAAVLVAFGGGGGGNFNYKIGIASDICAGRNGASGGGAGGHNETAIPGGLGMEADGQGHNGGSQPNTYPGGGGGGGAGARGGSATSSKSGDGGAGVSCDITGTSVTYGGGGGAGSYSIPAGEGGEGGGGAGNWDVVGGFAGMNGIDGLGGGGGGGGSKGNNAMYQGGGRGGNGVVILRYNQPSEVPVIAKFSLQSVGFTNASFHAVVPDIGVSAPSATLTIEVSDTETFDAVSGSVSKILADSWQGAMDVEAPCNSAMHARLILDNGVTAITNGPVPFTTLSPYEFGGIGYEFRDEGLAVSFAVPVLRAADYDVSLYVDGTAVPSATTNVTEAGSVEFLLADVSSETDLRLVLVSCGVTNEAIMTAVPGVARIIVDTIADHASAATALRLHAGDQALLPDLPNGTANYRVLNPRFATLAETEEGFLLTALEPGLVGIEYFDGEITTTMGVIVLPEPIGDGNTYIFTFNSNVWNDPSSWEKLGSEENDSWPRNPDDIAVVPFYDVTSDKYSVLLAGGSSVTNGALYAGCMKRGASLTLTLQSQNNDTVGRMVFARTDGQDVRIQAAQNDWSGNVFKIKFGGNTTEFEYLSDAVFDGGWDGAGNARNRGRPEYADSSVQILPAGRTLEWRNIDGYCSSEQTTFYSPRVSGGGTVWNNSSANVRWTRDESLFTGLIRDTSHGNVCLDRTGPTEFWSESLTDCSAEVLGFVPVNNVTATPTYNTSGYGIIHTGWKPYGNGSPSYHGCWFPGQEFRMVNSTFACGSVENGGWGIGVADVKRTDLFSIGRGFSYVDRRENDHVDNKDGNPINWFECSALDHEEKGTIQLNDYNRSDYPDPADTTNNVTILHGFRAFSIGGAENPRKSTEYSVVPWMVTPSYHGPYTWLDDGKPHQHSHPGIEFTCVDANERICDFLYRNTALGDCVSSFQNVVSFGKDITISSNLTVNSLSLQNRNSGKSLTGDFALTITSGGLIMHGNGSAIGTKDGGSVLNGHLVLGDEAHPGYVFSDAFNASEPNSIWSSVLAPGGLVFAYTGYALLGGMQTGIDDEIVLNAGVVDFGEQDGSAEVTIDAPIRILPNATAKFNNVVWTTPCDVCFDNLAGQSGRIVLGCNVSIRRLLVRNEPARTVAWASLPVGTYGSSESAAQFKDDTMFSGTGVLTVLSDATDDDLYGATPRVTRKDMVVGSTWFSVDVFVNSLGVGADILDVLIDANTDEDALEPTNEVTVVTNVPQLVNGCVMGLDPLTTYHYVLRFANGLENGTNDVSGTITTLEDSSWMAPVLSIKNVDAGFSALSSAVVVSSLGVASSSVTLAVDLATDENFSNIVRTEDFGVLTAPGERSVEFADLDFGVNYYIRYRAVSSKGEPAIVSQLCPALVYPCNVGIVGARSTETNTVFTLPITELIEGVVVTVSFAAQGASSTNWVVSDAATLVSPDVPYTPWGKATGYFSVTASVGGKNLPPVFRELTVSRGQDMYTPSMLRECDDIVLFPGDSLTLSELSEGDFYVIDQNEVVSVDDNNVLTALEPGFCYITRQTPDGVEGRFRSVDSTIIIVAPTQNMAPGGVFICRIPSNTTSTVSWTDASKWTRVFGTGDYPDGADCCAMIASRKAGETYVATPPDGVTVGFLGLASASSAVRDPGTTRILLTGANPLTFQATGPDGAWVRLRGEQGRYSMQAFEVPLKLESDLAFDYLGGVVQDTKFRRNVDVGDHVFSTRRGAYADTGVGYSGHFTFEQDVFGTGTIRLGADATCGWTEGSSRVKSFAGNIEVLNGRKTNAYGGVSGLCMGQIYLSHAQNLRVGGAWNMGLGGSVLTGGANNYWCWGWTNVWENPLPRNIVMDGGFLWILPLGPLDTEIPGHLDTHTFDSVTIQGAMGRMNSSFEHYESNCFSDMRTVIDDFYVESGATMCFDLATSYTSTETWTSTNVVIHTQTPEFGGQALFRTDYFYPYLIPDYGGHDCTRGYVRASAADGVYEQGQIHYETFDTTEKSDGNLRRFIKAETPAKNKNFVSMALDQGVVVSFPRSGTRLYNISGFVALRGGAQVGKVGNDASSGSSLCFEDQPAYFYVPQAAETAYVGCRISGTAGLVKSSPGRLCLTASSASSLSGGVFVNCGTLALGGNVGGTDYAGRTGSNEITVQPGAALEVNCSNGFSEETIVNLERSEAIDLAGQMILNADIVAKRVYVGGAPLEIGTYGSSDSPAQHVDDTLFSGPGVLRVSVDDIIRPTQIILH